MEGFSILGVSYIYMAGVAVGRDYSDSRIPRDSAIFIVVSLWPHRVGRIIDREIRISPGRSCQLVACHVFLPGR